MNHQPVDKYQGWVRSFTQDKSKYLQICTFLSELCISTKYAQKIYETFGYFQRHLMAETPKTHNKISFIDDCISVSTGTVLIRWMPVIDITGTRSMYIIFFYLSKRPTDLDSHLSTIAIRWTCQIVQCLHFNSFWNLNPNPRLL